MPLVPQVSLALFLFIQGGVPAPDPLDLRNISLDALIQRLPRVGSECQWDRVKRERLCDPATEEIQRRLIAGTRPTDTQWRDAMIGTGSIRIRSKWPKAVPFAISMRMPAWLSACEIRLQPRNPGLKAAKAGLLYHSTCGTFSGWVYQDALYQELGTLPLGRHRLEVDAVVEAGNGSSLLMKMPERPRGVIWEGSMTFDIEVVATVEEVVLPSNGEEVDARVRESLGVAFANWGEEGKRTALLVLDPDLSASPSLVGVALSLKIEVLNHGIPVEEMQLFANDYDQLALGNSVSKASQKAIAFSTSEKIPADLETSESARASWTLRVTGTTEDVLAGWDATRYWAGSLEIPIDEAIRGEVKRAGPTGRGSWIYSPRRR